MPQNDAEEDVARVRADALRLQVGHPGEQWEDLIQKVAADRTREFADVQDRWIALMWTLDAYKKAGVPPTGMGKPTQSAKSRLDGVYRSKGNWFATLTAALLANRTGQKIVARTRVQGFSQLHQIDLAWPAREIDPLVCVETKVTGGPAYGGVPSRASHSDFSNRRKELKFAATDLKLWRKKQATTIRHWGTWRSEAMPKTFFLWAARLRTDAQRPGDNDSLAHMIAEAKALVDTYMEGAGIVAWQENKARTGYEPIPVPASASATSLDDVLYRIESIIAGLAPGGEPPPPEEAAPPVVDVAQLAPDPVTE